MCGDPAAPHRCLLLHQPQTPRVCCSPCPGLSCAPSASPLCPIPSPPPWSSSPPSHAAHSEGFTEAGTDAISRVAFAWRRSYLIPASPRVRLARALAVVFLCFPFISPFQIRSRASAACGAGAPSLLPAPPCSHQPLPLPRGTGAHPGLCPACSQGDAHPCPVPPGTRFSSCSLFPRALEASPARLPSPPAQAGPWRGCRQAPVPRCGYRYQSVLPSLRALSILCDEPQLAPAPGPGSLPALPGSARAAPSSAGTGGHRCHPTGTLALALPRTSLAPGPSRPPGFQLLQSHRSHLCTYGPLSAVITDML